MVERRSASVGFQRRLPDIPAEGDAPDEQYAFGGEVAGRRCRGLQVRDPPSVSEASTGADPYRESQA